MAEITSEGFVAKTENEYFEEETLLYLDIDPLWNLDPSTPDGLKIASDSETFANLDEAAQAAYNSKDPDKARDLELNIVSSLSGAVRDDGSPSTIGLSLTGVNGTLIEAGKTVASTVDDTQWTTDTDVTIAGGVAVVNATAVINGATAADIATITNIVDTVGGWQTVTNDAIAVLGENQESNAELRLRRQITVGRPGNNQIDSMLGEIGTVDNVGRFRIYQNVTSVTDGNGLPGHSIAAIVEAGDDQAIAEAMFVKLNPGVEMYQAGTPVSVIVTSSIHATNIQDIKFSRPVVDDMNVVVTVINDGTLVGSTEQDIKDAILAYTNGNLVPADEGFNSEGFTIGEDVSVSRLYTPVNNVIGALGNAYITVLTVNAITTTVPVAFNALSTWTDANLSVSII